MTLYMATLNPAMMVEKTQKNEVNLYSHHDLNAIKDTFWKIFENCHFKSDMPKRGIGR